MTLQFDNALAYLFITWYIFMIGLSILGQCVAQLRYNKKPKPKSSSLSAALAPGVSILRPLKGLDLELEANLRSSFQQNYPKFELLFSVASADDPSIPIIQRLIKEYSKVDSRLIIGMTGKGCLDKVLTCTTFSYQIGEQIVGINPKINNMVTSYDSAKYDIIWILDSNVHVDEDTLGRSVDELEKPGIGLVHHLPMATQPSSYAAQVEQVFLNTNHAKMYLAINTVGIASCVMGKSNLYRRSDLDKAGGLAAFGKYMAEDNIVGEALWAQGLRHAMSADMACQVLGKITPKEYCGRRARWVRLRKYIVTAATLTEPFTESIVCGLMGSWAAHHLWPQSVPSMAYFFAIHWMAWGMNDYWLYRTLLDASSSPSPSGPVSASGRGNYRSKKQPSYYWPDFMRAWLAREVLALPLYMYAMVGTEISWRHQRYRCLSDGTAMAI